MEKWIVAAGEPQHGFSFHGPFSTRAEAEKFLLAPEVAVPLFVLPLYAPTWPSSARRVLIDIRVNRTTTLDTVTTPDGEHYRLDTPLYLEPGTYGLDGEIDEGKMRVLKVVPQP